MRKFFLPLAVMAALIRPTVTSTGTIFPSLMYSLIMSACGPPAARSARSRSPALKWQKPSCISATSHMVPFPAPGPPSTKTTLGLRGSVSWSVTVGAGATAFLYTLHGPASQKEPSPLAV